MGDSELKKRLKNFNDTTLTDWKAVKFKERSGDFADVIKPGEVSSISLTTLKSTKIFTRSAAAGGYLPET